VGAEASDVMAGVVRTAWIVGTSHDYQRARSDCGRSGTGEFRTALTAIATQKEIRAIAEEMSHEGLHGADDSVCRQVASALGVPHRYCDPSSQERAALGIAEDDRIRMSGHLSGRDPRAIEEDVRASFARREGLWADCVMDLDAWPLLFVCGANHAEPFRQRLQAFGIEARVLVENWAPHHY
jgi:hypothetical protein